MVPAPVGGKSHDGIPDPVQAVGVLQHTLPLGSNVVVPPIVLVEGAAVFVSKRLPLTSKTLVEVATVPDVVGTVPFAAVASGLKVAVVEVVVDPDWPPLATIAP